MAKGKQPKVSIDKNGDYYARAFKLHHCIGSKSFASQVARIQADAIADFVLSNEEKAKLLNEHSGGRGYCGED